ncbi:hypothetical protein BGX31_010532, partial [Mortierella sp. GBA43]
MFSSTVPSLLGTLSLQQALELTNVYLENAYKMKDPRIALVLCHNAEVALSQAKKANKKYKALPDDTECQSLYQGVAMAFIDLGKYLERRGTVGTSIGTPPRATEEQDSGSMCLPPVPKIKQQPRVATVPDHIFPENMRPPSVQFKLPQPDERLNNTPQLVCCLSLLKASHSPDSILDQTVQSWLQAIEKDSDEQERLYTLSIEVIRAFKRDEFKDAKAVAEVV